MIKKSIGVVGFGNMGQVVAEGVKSEYTIGIFDKDKEKLLQALGLDIYPNAKGLSADFPTLLLAVKPQDFDALLEELSGIGDKLIISCAAGICTHYIEERLTEARVIRTMPNMPAKIGQGMTCLCKGKFAQAQDLDFAKDIFKHVGEILEIDESMMNAATAISGNGPAYVCFYLKSHNLGWDLSVKQKNDFLEEFRKSAQGIGFSDGQARLLTEKTFSGTIAFLKQAGITPGDLILKVASKGGTTEAALKALDSGKTLAEAVKAGWARAEELSRRN